MSDEACNETVGLERSLETMEAYAASDRQKGNMATVLDSLYRKVCELREEAGDEEM